MSQFMTTLGRLGMLAGQLDTADKKKKAALKAAAEKQRQFNAEITSKYELERFKQDQANNRALQSLQGTLGAAMIRANASGNNKDQLGLSNMSQIGDMVNTSVLNYTTPDGTPLFSDNAFDGGDLKPEFQGPFGQLTGMITSQVLANPDVYDSPTSVNNAITQALTLLSPQVGVNTGYWGGINDVNLGFGGELGNLAGAFRNKLMSIPASERQSQINSFRDALIAKNIQPSVATQIIRLATQGI